MQDESLTISTHPETAVGWSDMGSRRRYSPNIDFPGAYIDEFHELLGTCPVDGAKIDIGLSGSLRQADALKIYEHAYFADGDLLELGTDQGLSAYVGSQAIQKSGRARRLVSIDISKDMSKTARKNLKKLDAAKSVDLLVGDGKSVCAKLIRKKRVFSFAFVDHSHAYGPVAETCQQLDALLKPGAFVVFHDFNDKRNSKGTEVGESHTEYGVFHAVDDHLPKDRFDFVGVYGCCGVFRKSTV